ncbi:MAG: DUF1570 domain-containing protein [Pirellulaceae bacterium]|nr:DUF1570 domain-containing protein [Pirellulaceae bacterium]
MKRFRSRVGYAGLTCFFVFLSLQCSRATDEVVILRGDQRIYVEGEILVEAQDGGLLLADRQGTFWAVQPDEIQQRGTTDQPFEPLNQKEASEHLKKELPGFRTHVTRHFVIGYNTSEPYARWCGALFERLYLAFYNYWRLQRVDLVEPKFPLVALVFASRDSYVEFAGADFGDAPRPPFGYFSLRFNRVMMYDLTGIEEFGLGEGRISSGKLINRVLSQPRAAESVATIIHEATHQIAFNCGIQTRYADVPMWVSEGLAIYFETPDLKSRRGWRGIGQINSIRLQTFRRFLATRPADSLATLIAVDDRFRSARTAAEAYAEAWALNYFLIKRKSEEYLEYTRLIAAKPYQVYATPEERLQEFKQVFGNLKLLDSEFTRYITALAVE